jgi:hypothetical protein
MAAVAPAPAPAPAPAGKQPLPPTDASIDAKEVKLYFDLKHNGGQGAQCRRCFKTWEKTNTTRLKEHWNNKHRSVPDAASQKKRKAAGDPAALLKWSGAHDEKLLTLIVKLITHHALPHSIIQTIEWREIQQHLRPESTVFGKDIVRKGVDEYFLEVKKAVNLELLASAPRVRLASGYFDPTAPPVVPLHMLTDKWTNLQGSSVCAVVACTPTPFYVGQTTNAVEQEDHKYVDNTAQSQLAGLQSIKQQITTELKTLSPTAEVVCASLTGDNENTMVALRKKVTADVTLDFALGNGCTPHGIDNFNKKFIAIPDVKSVVDATKDLNTAARNHAYTAHQLATQRLAWKATQKAAGVPHPKMPNPKVPATTRWHCYDDLLSAAILNVPLYIQVASDSKVQSELGDSLLTALSATHWQKATSIRAVLKAAKDAIKLSEGDSAKGCDINMLWLSIRQVIVSLPATPLYPWRSEAIRIFDEQYQDTRTRTTHGGRLWDLQQMLDPRQMQAMSTPLKTAAIQFAVGMAQWDGTQKALLQGELFAYITQQAPFNDPQIPWDMVQSSSAVVTWWTLWEKAAPNALRLVQLVMNIPTSAAAVERYFSAAGVIGAKFLHMKQSTADKLSYIYFNSRSLKRKKNTPITTLNFESDSE